ncbi:Rieske (2Fe-2S) protein [Actinomycetospora flava]|uniref:Rieske 2Fe-2S domain-containing protein n=1 Tax=Actinomycetospora flava TaxID=3129232 RepID=A0ABU8MHT5_9PSEU
MAATFTPVLPLAELGDGTMRSVMVGATRVLLVHVDGEVRAYDNRCPHRAWPLERGSLAGGVLTCANHRYTFDVATGRGLDPGGCDLVAHPCRVEADGTIAVAVP